MRYKVAIVDDDPQSSNIIKQYLNKFTQENKGLVFDILEYRDGDEILDEYPENLDIIFLDIDMKRIGGMKAAESIRKFDENVIIIFITNMSHYAIKGYTVDALSFLLKPVPYFAFSQELIRSIEKIEKNKEKYIFVKSGSEGRNINIRDIYYVEVIKHNLIFHTVDGNFTMRGTMKQIEEKLAKFNFVRNNNCYLINLYKVQAIEKDYVVVGNDKLPFSRSRKKPFIEALTSYIGVII